MPSNNRSMVPKSPLGRRGPSAPIATPTDSESFRAAVDAPERLHRRGYQGMEEILEWSGYPETASFRMGKVILRVLRVPALLLGNPRIDGCFARNMWVLSR